MNTTLSTARRHLEEAHRLLVGEDELSVQSRQALEILIDAFLAREYTHNKHDTTVIDFPLHRVSGGRG